MKAIAILISIVVFLCSEPSAQEIRMSSGFSRILFGVTYHVDGNWVSRQKVAQLIAEVPEANEDWKKARKLSNKALLYGGAPLIGALITFLVDPLPSSKSVTPAIAGGLAVAGGVAYFIMDAQSLVYRESAIAKYNQHLNPTVRIRPSNNGIGLFLNF